MSEYEKAQLYKRIDDFCDESDKRIDCYNRSKFDLIGSYEIKLSEGIYNTKQKKYKDQTYYFNETGIKLNSSIIEAA